VFGVLDDFLFVLRRQGFEVSTSQAIDVARVAREVGFEKRLLGDAIACVVLDRAERRPRFDAAFDAFFSTSPRPPPTFSESLSGLGFSAAEIAVFIQLLRELAKPEEGAHLLALAGRGTGLDHLLGREEIQKLLGMAQSRSTRGFYAHRVLDALAVGQARSLLARLLVELAEALGRERAEKLVAALLKQLDGVDRLVDAEIEQRILWAEDRQQKKEERLMTAPFAALSAEEREEVRKAVRQLAARLRGAARVRDRHRRRGRLDPARTVRLALATDGVPFRRARKARRRHRPKLVLLCDISESVRPVSAFMLELVYALHELFERARTFVFVSDIEEVTRLFDEEPVATAVAKAAASMVGARANSSYGRALRLFDGRFRDAVDRRTTVVILGDGRTNYQANGADVLGRIRERSKRLIWLCTEPRGNWGMGDSAMLSYAPQASQVLEVTSAGDLERAARELVSS
jgi:uncharacterized protein with von Willebrand factor type A (vWA) domain